MECSGNNYINEQNDMVYREICCQYGIWVPKRGPNIRIDRMSDKHLVTLYNNLNKQSGIELDPTNYCYLEQITNEMKKRDLL